MNTLLRRLELESGTARLLLAAVWAFAALPLLGVSGAADLPDFERFSIAPPTSQDAIGPSLAADGHGSAVMVWIERDPLSPEDAKRHRLMFSRLERDPSGAAPNWSEAVVVDEGDDFWPNWADTSGVVAAGSPGESADRAHDVIYVHRLQVMGEGTYDYGILLFRSLDGGRSFERLGRLNDDDVPAEHGFVSYAVSDEGVRAFWLDGRLMPEGGSQTLRTALLPAASTTTGTAMPGDAATHAVAVSQELDGRVCECCPTAAAATDDGTLVLYRDRSPQEVRDIRWVRQTARAASASSAPFAEPRLLHHDGWQINGCPVNGPSAAASGRRVWAAWFTGQPERRVSIAVSHDAGRNFERPLVVDEQRPFGRVQVVVDGDSNAWLSWLGGTDGGDRQASSDSTTLVPLYLARVTPGGVSPPSVLAYLPPGRSTGIARLAWLGETESRQSGQRRSGEGLVAVWLDRGKLTSEWLVARP